MWGFDGHGMDLGFCFECDRKPSEDIEQRARMTGRKIQKECSGYWKEKRCGARSKQGVQPSGGETAR